jgi:hypothetical protein
MNWKIAAIQVCIQIIVITITIYGVYTAGKRFQEANKKSDDGAFNLFKESVLVKFQELSTQMTNWKEIETQRKDSIITWEKLENHRKENDKSIERIHDRIDETNDVVSKCAASFNMSIKEVSSNMASIKGTLDTYIKLREQ